MINKIYDSIRKFLKDSWKIILFFGVLAFVCLYKLPFYIDCTGGLINTKKRVEVEDSYDVKGSFNMAYVNEVEATIPLYILNLFNKNWDVVKEEDMTYGNMTVAEMIEYGKITMKESNKDAITIAYKKADLEVKESNKNTVILYKDDKADTDLVIGDIIKKINNDEVTDFESITAYLKTFKIGDKLTFDVENNNKKYKRYARLVDIDGEAKIGIVLLETRNIETDPECKLSYAVSESGSSGGLMTTLTIYNYLVEEDLTGGLRIAGTGTIEKDGSVGEISGIKYKLAGVVKKKADLFFVPNGDNYEEAIKYKEENNYDIKIIGVSSFDEAVEYLENNIVK